MGRAAFLYQIDPGAEERFVRPMGEGDDGVDWGDAEVDVDGIYACIDTDAKDEFFLDHCYQLLNAVASLVAGVYVLGSEVWTDEESAVAVLNLAPEEARALVDTLPEARKRFADPSGFAREMSEGGWVDEPVELSARELREVGELYEQMVAFLAGREGGTYFVTVG